MKDCCDSFTISVDDINPVSTIKKVLYYVPFENLTIEEIDVLNTKMRNGPEISKFRGKMYEEVNLQDDSESDDPVLDTYIKTLKSLSDCDVLVTIYSIKSSPSRDTLIEFCKRLEIDVYCVSNDGQTTYINDNKLGISRGIKYC